MYLDIANVVQLKKTSPLFNIKKGSRAEQLLFNYLPGPVSLAEGVLAASSAEPDSHRTAAFVERFNAFRSRLCRKLNACRVQIMTGSGTLGNDVVAAHISLLPGKGLVLVNGEFGERLRDQAVRAGLDFTVLETEPGMTFSEEILEKAVRTAPQPAWVWTVHCETSTGVLNDLEMLRRLCRRYDLKLCLDAVSSIGSCSVDLSDVYLATATSGKGIGSLPGLVMVFCRDDVVTDDRRLPRYFDLGYYESKQGIPFTISSNAVDALITAVEEGNWTARFEHVQQWSEELRSEIEEAGLTVLADRQCRAPHITTIALPVSIASPALGDQLEKEGILVSYRSDYLIAKNYIQVCFMGKCQRPTRMMTYFLRQAAEGAEPGLICSCEEEIR